MACTIIFAFILINTVLVAVLCCMLSDRKWQFKKLADEKKSNNEPYTEEDLKDEIEPNHAYVWICAIAVCLDIWIVGAVLTHWWAGKYFTDVANTDSNRALFGDSFGAVNALISAFAFASMVVALILQRYELRLQRKELKEQRGEFSKQNETLRLQRFENTFFNMLGLQQQIVSDLSTKDVKKVPLKEDAENGGILVKEGILNQEIAGRDLFRYAFEECVHNVKEGNEKIKGLHGVMNKYGFSHYDKYYTSTYFDHYFRHFYRILKFVKQNEDWLTFEEQYKYTSMLRGTLSRYELVWLFYNGLSDNGREKLKPLMEQYSMLKNLRPDFLALCKENGERLTTAGFSEKQLSNFSDYEFAVSKEKGTDKYHLSAFYNEEEIQKGIAEYDRWTQFCEEKGISMP